MYFSLQFNNCNVLIRSSVISDCGFCDKHVFNRAIVAFAMLWLVTAFVSAQITFSRDWTGGKRAAPQLAVDCGQFSRVCRHFIQELKQAMSSEITGKSHRRPDEELPSVYDDEK